MKNKQNPKSMLGDPAGATSRGKSRGVRVDRKTGSREKKDLGELKKKLLILLNDDPKECARLVSSMRQILISKMPKEDLLEMFTKDLEAIRRKRPKTFMRLRKTISEFPKPAWSSDSSYSKLNKVIVQKFPE